VKVHVHQLVVHVDWSATIYTPFQLHDFEADEYHMHQI